MSNCHVIHNRLSYADSFFYKLLGTTVVSNSTRTVFLGDSIMQKLHVLRPNFGIGGDTTYDLIKRWPMIHKKIPFVTNAWVHIGLNDLRHNESVKCTFKQIIVVRNLLENSNIQPIFLTILPADVQRLANIVSSYMKKSNLSIAYWNIPPSMYSEDHIHPNAHGKVHLIKQLMEHIERSKVMRQPEVVREVPRRNTRHSASVNESWTDPPVPRRLFESRRRQIPDHPQYRSTNLSMPLEWDTSTAYRSYLPTLPTNASLQTTRLR